MGNYISCSSSCGCACLEDPTGAGGGCVAESKRKLQRCMIVVVHSVEGRVIEVGGGGPMKVAEIMLEFPGQFVCQYETETHIMNRATPLPADHEALPGRVYILFPLQKLHTRLSPLECSSYVNLLHLHLAVLKASRKKLKKQLKGSKVTPVCNTMQLPNSSAQREHHHHHQNHPALEVCPSDEEIDSFLVQFCTSQPPKASSMNATCTLSRSKSWIPRLETISES